MSTAVKSSLGHFHIGLLVRWLAATLIGWVLGLYICDLVKEMVYEFTHFNIDGVIIGTCIGLAQMVALLGYLKMPLPVIWLIFSIVGYGIGKAIGDTFAPSAFLGMAFEGMLIGICVGLAQVLLLRDNLSYGLFWPLINVVAWVIGWSIIGPATAGEKMHPVSAYINSSIGALLMALITGVFLGYFYHRAAEPGSENPMNMA